MSDDVTAAPAIEDGSAPEDLAPAGNAPSPAGEEATIDLDRIAGELNDVEVALGRLADGTYWTDESTGQALPDDLLAASPIARTVNDER